MNKLESAMDEVIARLTSMTTDQLITAAQDAPALGFGSIFVETGAFDLYLKAKHQEYTSLSFAVTIGSEMRSSKTVADYEVEYKRATCLLAA